MEVILQLFKQLPPFWPRMAALVVLILLLALPQTRRILTRGGVGDRRLERAKRLLEVRKLQLEVAALRAAHPEGGESVLDAQIAGILAKPLPEYEEESPPLPWTERLKLSGTGGASFLLIGTLAAGLSGMREGLDLVMLAAKELLAVIPAVLVASAIPARDRWGPVFYGFLMPILIVALAVTARIRADSTVRGAPGPLGRRAADTGSRSRRWLPHRERSADRGIRTLEGPPPTPGPATG